jgi:hypothetical protein
MIPGIVYVMVSEGTDNIPIGQLNQVWIIEVTGS